MEPRSTYLNQLQLDNTSHTFDIEQDVAAEEADDLTEDYTTYTSGSHEALPPDAAQKVPILAELRDAARRKDRRIHRLTSLLASERVEADALKARVAELEELKALSEEMEETLHASIQALQSQVSQPELPSTSSSFLDVARNQLAHKLLSVATIYAPQSAHPDFFAYHLLLHASSLHTLSDLTTEHLYSTPVLRPFVDLFERVRAAATDAVAWCFEVPSDIPSRAANIHSTVSTLETRAASLFSELKAVDEAARWSQQFSSMKLELVTMAIDAVRVCLPRGFTSVLQHPDFCVIDVCNERAADFASVVLSSREGQLGSGRGKDDLMARLTVATAALEARKQEIEDLRVRNAVFEDRISAALVDSKRAEALQIRVEELEQELLRVGERNADINVDVDTKIVSEENVHTEDNPKVSAAAILTPAQLVDAWKETKRLRAMLVQRRLGDLCAPPFETNEKVLDVDRRTTVRNVVADALNGVRVAASMARVVVLDKETLQPVTRGATMSRKTLLQSLAVSQKACVEQGFPLHMDRYGESTEVQVGYTEDRLVSMMELFRKREAC